MTGLISPSVSLVNGRPCATSLKIAEHFGKRHEQVLRSIRSVSADCPEEFTEHNFVLSDYTDETGRTLPMFNVFQDGFVILGMGYTGPKAMKMKLAYIMAFNAMRDELNKAKPKKKALPPAPEPADKNRDFQRVREDLQLTCKLLDAHSSAFFFLMQSAYPAQTLIMEKANTHVARCQAAVKTALEELRQANYLACMLTPIGKSGGGDPNGVVHVPLHTVG